MTTERVKICPKCGKANRGWREHCMYCQTILTDVQKTDMDTSEIMLMNDEKDKEIKTNAPAEASKDSVSVLTPVSPEQLIVSNNEGKAAESLPRDSTSNPVTRKVLKSIIIIFGASGALVLWQRLDHGFAEAIDTGDWGYVIAWVVIAVLVLGVFWLASKL